MQPWTRDAYILVKNKGKDKWTQKGEAAKAAHKRGSI